MKQKLSTGSMRETDTDTIRTKRTSFHENTSHFLSGNSRSLFILCSRICFRRPDRQDLPTDGDQGIARGFRNGCNRRQGNQYKRQGAQSQFGLHRLVRKHETGAGKAPYMFKTDAKGTGAYSAPLGESPFGKWEMLMVVLHPNGDPKDMKNMVGALSTGLK
jgi:hypothetical protein